MKYKDEHVAINKVATEENRTLHDGNQKVYYHQKDNEINVT